MIKPILFSFLVLVGCFAISAQGLTAVEAENGTAKAVSDPAVFINNTEDSITFLSVSEDFAATGNPGNDKHIVEYNVTFAEAGSYHLYVRLRIGAGGASDDSFYVGKGFGSFDPTGSDWSTINNISGLGYTALTDTVKAEGSAGSEVWKWLNLTALGASTYEVPEGALTQTFSFGGRENGLDIDKFVFAPENQSVAQLGGVEDVTLTPLVVQAETGTQVNDDLAVFSQKDEEGVTYLSVVEDFSGTSFPGTGSRMLNYDLTFEKAGDYELYARLRISEGGVGDDSFYFPTSFGSKDSVTADDWVTVNNISDKGWIALDSVVTEEGSAGIQVWKWINLSKLPSTDILFTVPEGQLSQTFQLGSRENGFEIDAFVFGGSDIAYTVAELDILSGYTPVSKLASVTISSGVSSLNPGDSVQIAYELNPQDAGDVDTLVWEVRSIDVTSLATINAQGWLKGVKAGGVAVSLKATTSSDEEIISNELVLNVRDTLAPPAFVTFEAEDGMIRAVSDPAVFVETTEEEITFLNVSEDVVNGDLPALDTRVVEYEITFPVAGTYQLYGRVRVGAESFNDDSFFLGNKLGSLSATDSVWAVVNGLASRGYSGLGDLVDGDGSVGALEWKWVNFSLMAAVDFTVSDSALTQKLAIGARENGLDIDKFVFAEQGKTVLELEGIKEVIHVPLQALQAEVGLPAEASDPAVFTEMTEGQVSYISVTQDVPVGGDGQSPGTATRVMSYEVTFDTSGVYDLYARVKVQPGEQGGAVNDSFFFPQGFGQKNPTTAEDWVVANGLSGLGYVGDDSLVMGAGTVGADVWKWINLSTLTGNSVRFTVPEQQLTQTFQIGSREDGLDIDLFVFASPDSTYTVESLNLIGGYLREYDLESIAISSGVSQLNVGDSVQLSIELNPAGSTNIDTLVWQVNATGGSADGRVNAAGWLTGLAPGEISVSVIAKTSDTTEISSNALIMFVNDTSTALTRIQLSATSDHVAVGDSLLISYELTPGNANNFDGLIWSLSVGDTLATITDDGYLKALGNGEVTVTITAQTSFGDLTDDLTISLGEKVLSNISDKSIAVYPNPMINGTINVDGLRDFKALRVLDLKGTEVMKVELSGQDHVNLALKEISGLYLLELVSEQRSVIKKIVIR